MMKPQLTPKDWQLLSEYLDGQLSQRDQAKLEQRLQKQPDLQSALDEMRQMRSVLRAVPHRKVPHNFTLTHAMIAEQQQPSRFLNWIPALSISSALATLILVVSLLFGGAPALTAGQQAGQAPTAAQAMLAQKGSGEATDQTGNPTEPPVVIWNGGNNAAPAYGLGGGPDGRGGGGGGGQDLGPQMAVPQQPPALLAQPNPDEKSGIETTPLPNDTPVAPGEAQALTAQQPQPTLTGEAAPQALAQAPSSAAPAEGSGPILGVAPKDEQGKITSEQPDAQPAAQTAQEQAQPKRFSALLAAQFGLALIAIAAALGAILLRIRSRS